MTSKTVSVFIHADPQKVYDFISDVENLPKWATEFCRSVKKPYGEWIIETSRGPAGIRMTEKNSFGVLDHFVSPSPGVELYVPMRVVPNGPGSELIFTLFQQSGVSDKEFAQDLRWVEQYLKTLKSVMES